jgi:putative addiction module killer protein
MDKITEVLETEEFTEWLKNFTDMRTRSRVTDRTEKFRKYGHPGRVEPVGEGVSEMKIDYGPGLRIYYIQMDRTVVILLIGGDKGSQKKDIKLARKLAKREREKWRKTHGR